MENMEKLMLKIISPEKLIYSGDVAEVTLPNSIGPFTILPRHAPIISSLIGGYISFVPINKDEIDTKLFDTDGDKCKIKIADGFVEMSEDNVTICVTL